MSKTEIKVTIDSDPLLETWAWLQNRIDESKRVNQSENYLNALLDVEKMFLKSDPLLKLVSK